MNTETQDNISSKLLKAKIKSSATGELLEGYPICVKNKDGENAYWMFKFGCTVEEITTGGLVFLAGISSSGIDKKILTAKAKSFVTGEWVEGYPFFAKAETKESSYWLVKSGSTVEDLLSEGLINIIPETIVYKTQ